MGGAKRLMEENEALRGEALQICLDVGALEECENHPGSYFDGGEEIQEAYKIANGRITNGEIELPSRISRRDFTDIIKDVYEDNYFAESCTYCQRNMERD
jgi:hypothetical protein